MAILRIDLVLSIGLTTFELAQARFLRGESAIIPASSIVCVTEKQCQQKFLAMNTGGRFSVGEYAYKGCIYKNNNGFFGTGGTAEEMSVAEFSGIPERIWCDAATVTVNLIHVMPTILPVTYSPSTTPTKQPTVIPSVSISFEPSKEPSSSLTTLLSISPSIRMTMEPSYSPSTSPSFSASTKPSYSPSTSSSEYLPPLKHMFMEIDDDYENEIELLGNQSRSTKTEEPSVNYQKFLLPTVFVAGFLLAYLGTLFAIKTRLVRIQDERRSIDDDNVSESVQTSFEEPVEVLEITDDENMRSFPSVAVSENDAGPMERALCDLLDNWRRAISTETNLPPSPIIIRNPADEEDDDDDDDHSSTLANTIDLFPKYIRSADDNDDNDDSRSISGSSSSSGPSYASPLSFVKSPSIGSRVSIGSRIFTKREIPASESDSAVEK